MFLTAPQVIWSLMLAVGLQFLHLGACLRMDRAYGLFAFSLLTICLGAAGEVWLPGGGGPVSQWWSAWDTGCGFLAVAWGFLFLSRAIDGHAGSGRKALAGSMLVGLSTMAVQRGVPPWKGVRLEAALTIAQAAFFLFLSFRVLGSVRHASPSPREWRFIPVLSIGALALAFAVSVRTLPGGPGISIARWSAVALYAVCGMATLLGGMLALHERNRASLEALAQAYNQLQEGARLRELGASAAFISHEIKNYVSKLKGTGFARPGKGGEEGPPGSSGHLDETVARLETLTADITAYASPLARQFPKAQIRLDALAKACAGKWLAGCPCTIQSQSSADSTVAGDAGKLEQVFANLFKNAVEAGASQVEVRFRAWGNRLSVAVEDDGRGCRAEDLPRLFLPFVSEKTARGGSGLGTTIAERILADHGASMRAYAKNALGRSSGLIIVMVFPLPERKAARAPVIAMMASDAGAGEEMLRPLANLGIMPQRLEPAAAAAGRLAYAKGGILLADPETAAKAQSGSVLLIVDRMRVARPAPGEGGTEPFLFTEENILARLSSGDAIR